MLKEFTPIEAKEACRDLLAAGIVPFLKGPPGIAKSSIFAQLAKEYNLFLIDIRLSTFAPEDLNGLPMRNGNRASFTPFDNFPLEDDEIPEGYDGFLILLDEITSAAKSVEAAAYRLVLDLEVGKYKLHPNAFVVCAGNGEQDGAIARRLGTAMRTRVGHINLEVHHESFIEHALTNDFDTRVIGYLMYEKNDLHIFNKDGEDDTYPCPRTWEFVSNYIKVAKEPSTKVIGGLIGFGVAHKFTTYLEVYASLPTYSEIAKFPERTKIPTDMATRYAVSTMLLNSLELPDFENVSKYMERLPTEYQMVFFRGVAHRHPKIKNDTKLWAKCISHLQEYVDDDSDNLAA